jgi:hypothetical protein
MNIYGGLGSDGIPVIVIPSMEYRLDSLIKNCILTNEEIDFHDRQIWDD